MGLASPRKSSSYRKNLWVAVVLCLLILLLEIFAYTHNFFLPNTGNHAGAKAPLAILKSTQNEVMHKSDGTLIWKNPEAGNELFREDAIATMNDSQAVIAFADQSELVIEPNSLVILEMAPQMEKQAGSQATPIIARLIKGSMRRKTKGPSMLLVKLSSRPDAKTVELDDPLGSAVFRLIHNEWGLQVVVEGGKITVNKSQTLNALESADITHDTVKLPSPRLKKPTIEIKRRESQGAPSRARAVACWGEFFLPCAWAEDEPAPLEVNIHFDWEATPGSSSYLVQISKDISFSQIILEKQVNEIGYTYSFASDYSPTDFFFRVAAQSAAGETGKFSDPQRVEVRPEMTRPSLKQAAKKAAEVPAKVPAKKLPAPPKKLKSAAKKKMSPPLIARSETAPSRSTHLEIALGAMYHHREFKGTSAPKSATGSGFVPSRLRVEGIVLGENENSWVYSFGGTYLFEVGKPTLSTLKSSTKLGTPFWRAWFLAGSTWNSLLLSAGPYATSSSVIRFSGLDLVSQSKILLGALARLSPHPDSSASFHWSTQLGLIASGSMGADFSFSFQQPLDSFGRLKPYRASEKRGYFWGAETMMRWTKMETAYGAVIEIGRIF